MAPKPKLPLLALAAALALATTACTQLPLPTTYTIAPDFTDEQAGAIAEGYDAWCAAVGYCPEQVPWPGAADSLTWVTVADREMFMSGAFAAQSIGAVCSSSGECEAREIVEVSRAHVVFQAEPFRHAAWVLATTHEIGHLCIDGHPADLQDGVMRTKHSDLEHSAITAGTAEAFVAGCGL